MDRNFPIERMISFDVTNNGGRSISNYANGVESLYYQFLSTQSGGRFIPGRWRINPVMISRTTFAATSNSVTVPYTFNNVKYRAILNGPAIGYGFFSSSAGPSYPGRALPAWNSNAASLSHIRAFEKMNSPDLWDAGVFLGELTETIGMLVNPFAGLRKVLRHKNFRDPKKLVNASANTWMEFRYGIMPFANDIAAIAALFSKRALKAETHINRATKGSAPLTSRSRGTVTSTVGNFWLERQYASTFEDKYTSGVGYITKPGIYSHLHSYGLAVQDVPNLLWELTPLSFVVDWFYSVGPWIRAITPNPSVAVLGSYTSRKLVENGVCTCKSVTYSNGKVPGNNHMEWLFESLERRSGTALPALPARTMDFSNLKRSIDSAALLWQRLPSAWIHARR